MRMETAPVASFQERGGALLLHVGMGREILEGEHIVGRADGRPGRDQRRRSARSRP